MPAAADAIVILLCLAMDISCVIPQYPQFHPHAIRILWVLMSEILNDSHHSATERLAIKEL